MTGDQHHPWDLIANGMVRVEFGKQTPNAKRLTLYRRLNKQQQKAQ